MFQLNFGTISYALSAYDSFVYGYRWMDDSAGETIRGVGLRIGRLYVSVGRRTSVECHRG